MAKGTKPQRDDERSATIAAAANVEAQRRLELFESVLRNAFESRHDLIVHELVRVLRAVSVSEESAANVSRDDWIGVESLSRLRSIVGGRFENIKRKWIAAGFPLKEHRGERHQPVAVSERGWIELSNWIIKQGFEARLTPERDDRLFELKNAQGGERRG